MSKYLEQGKKNWEFFTTLDVDYPSDFHDWKITVIFYSSLHFINHYIDSLGLVVPDNHKETFHFIRRSGKCNTDVKRAYSNLYGFSHSARYDGFISPIHAKIILSENLSDAQDDWQIIKQFVDAKTTATVAAESGK